MDLLLKCEADAGIHLLSWVADGNQVTVLNKKSTDMHVGEDMPRRADIVVSEVTTAYHTGA